MERPAYLQCKGPKRFNGIHADGSKHCKTCGHHHCRFCQFCVRCGCGTKKLPALPARLPVEV